MATKKVNRINSTSISGSAIWHRFFSTGEAPGLTLGTGALRARPALVEEIVKRLDQTELGMIEPPSRQRRGATGGLCSKSSKST
jgi:hypothetical protein